MTWAILGILAIVALVSLFLVVRLTVTVSRTSSNALASLISFDQRAGQERAAMSGAYMEQTKGLVDRIMSADWESVRLHEGADESEPGGFFTPEEQQEQQGEDEEPSVEILGSNAWRMSNAQERADVLDEVESLAAEDDLDGFDAERAAKA